MTALTLLWLPILLSAVFVFVVSSVIHMALPIHRNDYQKLPDEASLLESLRRHTLPPGQYVFPSCKSMQEMGQPEMLKKYQQGPVGFLLMRKAGIPNIGPSLAAWFLFCIVVSVFVGYLTGLACKPGSEFLAVFRVAGACGVLGYAFTNVTESIWKGVAWRTAFKFVFDGLVYGLVTAATFAWLWPATV